MMRVFPWIENAKRPLRTIRFRALKTVYWWILNLAYRFKWLRSNDIPVIINNFNRITTLVSLIKFLERCGFTRIIILDNHSTYPPLLKYYGECPHLVFRLSDNLGHLAFWKSGLFRKYKWNYFMYSDSDVLPIEDCPEDFIEYFKSVLDRSSFVDKVGFGIKTDDLPDTFGPKMRVILHEEKFWKKEVEPGIFEAQIDTTFALYKPLSNLKFGETSTLQAYRFGPPYVIRHLPWYQDSSNLSEEESYYLKTSTNSSSIARQLRTGDVYL